jgi:Calcineurin-like phosphoesterase
VYYGPQDHEILDGNYKFAAEIFVIKPENLESKGERLVHTALLTNLIAGTIYEITVRFGQEGHEKFLRYKAPPNGKMRIVVGGDVGNTKRAKAISSMIGKQLKPDVIFIGGDIAYDNDLRSCYYTYDKILEQIEMIYTDIGHMIPIILAIGNHDVGFDASTGILKTLDLLSSFYFLYFPQHFDDYVKTVPAVKSRRTNHFHQIGNIIFFTLDTGYIKGYDEQVGWIEDISTKFYDKIKFAGYHVPIYTTCTQNFQDEFYGQTFWVPVFDKFKFQASFEHHQHILSKTYPLRDSAFDPKGTYYLGDGAWGADLFPNCTGPYPDLSKIFEFEKNLGHIWLMDIYEEEKTITYAAYNEEGIALIPPFNQSFHIET